MPFVRLRQRAVVHDIRAPKQPLRCKSECKTDCSSGSRRSARRSRGRRAVAVTVMNSEHVRRVVDSSRRRVVADSEHVALGADSGACASEQPWVQISEKYVLGADLEQYVLGADSGACASERIQSTYVSGAYV